MTNKLDMQFEEEVRDNTFIAKKECKYNPTYFLKMLAEHGGVKTAKILIEKAIHTGNPSDGFTTLLIKGRLDLTIESSVISEKYSTLFSVEEVNYCKKVLGKNED